MNIKHETKVVAAAHEEASRIIRGQEREDAAELLEDLLDYIQQAQDCVRELADAARINLRPRPTLDFPDRRSVTAMASNEISREAQRLLGFVTNGDEDEDDLKHGQIRELCPELDLLISANTEFYAERQERSPAKTGDNAVNLALQVLRDRTREIAQVSLDELDPGLRDGLLHAAIREIAGEAPAWELMEEHRARRAGGKIPE